MLLIQNADYLIVSADQVLRHGDLLVDGNRIRSVGRGLSAQGCERVISAAGKIVSPGLINAHTHLYQNMLKGMGDCWRLKEWCEQVTFPFSNVIHRYERQLGDQSLGYAYGMLGAMEMVKNGITAFVDMDNNLESQLQAWQDLGIRGALAIQSVNRWVPKELMIPDEQRLAQLEETIIRWNGRGLQSVYIAPSTPFTCTADFMRKLLALAQRWDVRIQTHVAETRWEVEQSLRESGKTPLAYLESIGFLERPIQAVHGVCLTEEEMELCRRRGITVVYNPKSNAKLASGIAPIARLRELGVSLCLATDGAASNDLLDLFEEMRFGAMLQKLYCDNPAAFGQREIFRMATEEGAQALGLDAGRLEAGRLADIILIDCASASMAPVHDPVSALVYCGRGQDVDTVIIDGRIVMEHRQILTVPEVELLQQSVLLGERRFAEVDTGPLASMF